MSTDPDPDSDTDSGPESDIESDPLEPGMLVVDREQDHDERDPAVVMSRPPVPADQWEVAHIDGTLADDNPDYPADARPVIVIYCERFEDTEEYDAIPVPDDVREKLSNGEPVSIAATRGLTKFYAFPEPRLKPTGERWPPTPVPSSSAAGETSDSPEPEAPETPEHGRESGDEPHGSTATTDALGDAEPDAGEETAGIDLSRLAGVMHDAGFDDVEQHGDHVTATKLGETYRVDHSGEVTEGGALADKLASFIDERYAQQSS